MTLGAYVLWRINFIHPFINGNGRTARAAAYFVICLKLDGWLPGTVILPDLLRANRAECVDILRRVDASHLDGQVDLEPLKQFIHRLVDEQINSAGPDVVLPPGYRPRLPAETEPTQ